MRKVAERWFHDCQSLDKYFRGGDGLSQGAYRTELPIYAVVLPATG